MHGSRLCALLNPLDLNIITFYDPGKIQSGTKESLSKVVSEGNIISKDFWIFMIVTRTESDIFWFAYENAKICVLMLHLSSVSLQSSVARKQTGK